MGADLATTTPPPDPENPPRPTPAGVRSGLSGFAEIHLGSTTGEFAGGDGDGSQWALRGAVNRGLGDGWNLQLDGLYGRAKLEDATTDILSGTAHGYFRRPHRYAVGAYVTVARAGTDALSQLAALNFDQDMTAASGGLEGAYFLDRTTIFAQAGFAKLFLDDIDLDRADARGGVRFYATDNLRLDLEGGFRQWRADDAKVSALSLTTVANYRLSSFPVSAFGGYRFEKLSGTQDDGSKVDGKSHGLLAGFRYHFGSTSLKDEERNGALWSMPRFGL